MRIAYFDAVSGISGDMTIGALLDAGAPKIDVSSLAAALSALGVGGYRLTFDRVKVGALAAGSFDVVLDSKGSTHIHEGIGAHSHQIPHAHHDHHNHAGRVEAHPHERGKSASEDCGLSSHDTGHGPSRNWPAIRALIESAGGRGLGAGVVERALTVFEALAKAEAAVHGIGVEEVHFHEVGAVDAIVDIVGTAWCLDELGIERCFVGPLPGGKSGYVQTEHGLLPVPAPATLRLLEGFEVIPNDGEGELVTPTGAAILHALARPIRPLMTIAASGTGAGKKRWSDRPNILRVFIGESSGDTDREVVMIETDIDDMAPTALAFAAEKVRAAGAIDVTISAVDMKKGRVGHRLTVLADPEHMESLARTILEETTSLGVRFRAMGRFVLPRRIEIVATPFGPVAVKVALRPSGRETAEPEFDDVAGAALASGVPFATVHEAALAAWTALAR